MEGLSLNSSMWLTGWSVLALLGYAVAAWGGSPERERWMPAVWAIWLAWLAQAAALVVDWGGLVLNPPGARFGFAPAISLMLWLVWTVVLIESRFLPLHFMRRVLALMAGAAVALAWVFPGQVHAAATPWAPLHWVLGLASYGLLGTAVMHAWLLGRAERQMRHPGSSGPTVGLPLLRLERLTFQFVGASVLVLGLALVLGAALGAPWRWDHKTVFSVLAWGVLAALLAGRHWLGWRGAQATRWLYVGAALLLMAYVGSRFVLQIVLERGG